MGRPKGSKNKSKSDAPSAGPVFFIDVAVPRYHLGFAVDGKPKTLIQIPVPQKDWFIEIRPDKGRAFGDDDEDGTPCTLEANGYTESAAYFAKDDHATVRAWEVKKKNASPVADVSEEAGEGSDTPRPRRVRRSKSRK